MEKQWNELREQYKTETGKHWLSHPASMDYALWLEQRLLVSSEAEKGVRVCSYAEIRRAANEYARDQWKNQEHQTGSSVLIEYARKDFIEGAMFVHKMFSATSSPSPQEKQGVKELFTDEDLAVEVVARFTANYGRNGQWSQRIKQDFIDGAMWAKNKQK